MLFNRIKKLFVSKNEYVTYDESFFREGWFKNWELLKYVLYELIKTDQEWKNILDFGCGPGIMIDFMNDQGFNYFGCDDSEEARLLYVKRFGKYPQKYFNSIEQCCDITLDFFLAFDVFEHMTDKEISILLQQIKHIPTLFLNISRAKGIPGHINLKKDAQWIRFFRKQEFHYLKEKTRELRGKYSRLRPGSPDLWDKNMFVFSRE